MTNVSIYDKMTQGERQTADYLTYLGIFWKYHHPVTITDEEDLSRIYYPDFSSRSSEFISKYAGLIEKKSILEGRSCILKNNIKVVFVETFKDGTKWKFFLLHSLFKTQVERMSLLYAIAEENIFSGK